ncbi:hypothetical protein MMC13_004190 [Lambiella insularis]|nr:hypothetical protein [Lambiella insularis]
MDGLSAATTVISILQTALQVINYVKAVRGAKEERQILLLELIRARGLLATLTDVTEEVGNDNWSQALQSLDGPHGPLYTFKVLLEEIIDEMAIVKASNEARKTQQSALMVLKAKLPKLVGYYRRNSSSSIASTKHSEDFQPPFNNHHEDISIKLDSAIKDLKWPFTQSRLQELLNTLERIKTHFLVALCSDNVRLSKLIRDELETVHGKVLVIKDNTTAIREHQEGSKEWTYEQRLIFQSISTLDFSSRISPDMLDQLKRGASWLLDHDTFHQWRTGEWRTGGSTLLLSGMAGCGKSSICRVVESYLQSSGSSSEVFVVAIYFSYHNRPENQSLQAVLAFVVEHMLRVRPQFQKHYNKLMLTGEGPLEIADCLKIIHRARQDFQHFYIILDALDECDHQQAQEIVKKLTGLRTPLKIFATSRPDSSINYFSYNITMSEEDISVDIKAYIREGLSQKLPIRITRSLTQDPTEFERVVETITAQSQGLFLFASLLIDQLCTAKSKSKFNQILNLSPQIASHIYTQRLELLTEQEEGNVKPDKRDLEGLLSTTSPISAKEPTNTVASNIGTLNTNN